MGCVKGDFYLIFFLLEGQTYHTKSFNNIVNHKKVKNL